VQLCDLSKPRETCWRGPLRGRGGAAPCARLGRPVLRVELFALGTQFRYDLKMAHKSIKVELKRRLPATGKDQLVGVRLPDATIRRIDAWAQREGVTSRRNPPAHRPVARGYTTIAKTQTQRGI
jgi:hypothetical protein